MKFLKKGYYMSEILFINACIREKSRTLELAKDVLNKIGGTIEEVKINDLELPFLDMNLIKKRDEAKYSKDFSNEMFNNAKQFAAAKNIVIAAPYWDLMFPAVLKCYFENIIINGLTFEYGINGIPKGLCNADRLIYVTTSGGPIINNFGYDYVYSLSKTFFGIKEVKCISAQGLDIYGADSEKILRDAKKGISI